MDAGTIQMDKLFNFIWNSRFDRWIDCDHDSSMQIDKLFNFIWNSRFDGWIDCIHDCIHSTIQMDTDPDGYRYRYKWIGIQYGWIQMDKLFNSIWNSRFDRWIDCIHDCLHSTIQMDTDIYCQNFWIFRIVVMSC